ncbi:MAG: fluoride efflux transporter FluC [Nocardioidaceae bacterium]
MTLLLVLVGGALGAPARYAVSRALNRLRGFPWGTLSVNAGGSLALGLLLGNADGAALSDLETLAVAFCGGFTTYSAFAVETAELGRWRGTVYATATVVAGIGAAAFGWRLA